MPRILPTLVVLALLASPALAEDAPLIPRETFFGNPDRAATRLSPDGTALAFLAPLDGVLNVWVAPRSRPDQARAVTQDTGRGIQRYFWAFDNRHIVFLQDENGNENWHVYALDLVSGEVRDLTPVPGIAARIQGVSHKRPHEILVGINDRTPMLHDLHLVDIRTGERTLVAQNEGFLRLFTDDEFIVRAAARMRPDGGMDYLTPGEDGGWTPFLTVPMEDAMTTRPVGWDDGGEHVYALDSRGRDTAALVRMDMKTLEIEVLGEDPRADVYRVMSHPTEDRIEAFAVNHLKPEWTVIDPAVAAEMKVLRKVEEGEIVVGSRSLDDRYWIVAYWHDDGPVRIHLYDRETQETTFLHSNQSELDDLPLVPMHPVVIPARDGLELVSYLSLPPGSDPDGDGRPEAPLPMVLHVHGGPWARDGWGYNPIHQWLANRGYAVLSVNFRGSTGFGKAFINAADRQWARAMQDDLLDGVAWAVEQGVADPDKVAISGGSYGGYATLVGLTQTPETFAAGVDIVGPSNLVTLFKSMPAYWKPMIDMFKLRVGDPDTEEGLADMRERSPLTHVANIQRPLLIGQGANDPRVKQAEADQIVEAMQAKELPVVYVLYPDEGHGFSRPENRLSFFAIMEAFLAQVLGGRAEPLGDALEGSSIQVPEGGALIPGLPEAMEAAATGTAADPAR